MSASTDGLPFSKLEALGNDFVVLDFRRGGGDPSPDQIQRLADRHTGVGFDQLLILHPPRNDQADCRIEIYNADGSSARQCGNGMRAVALWLHQSDSGKHRFQFDTAAGAVTAQVEDRQTGDWRSENQRIVTVSMGQPDFSPAAAGLIAAERLQQLAADLPGLLRLGTVSVGNPHLVLLLDRPASAARVERVGLKGGLQDCFADGVNISFAAITGPNRVKLAVFERGVGPTRACGSAACATAAWLIEQAVVQTPVRIDQPGGTLVINWPGWDNALLMQGPARRVFEGRLP